MSFVNDYPLLVKRVASLPHKGNEWQMWFSISDVEMCCKDIGRIKEVCNKIFREDVELDCQMKRAFYAGFGQAIVVMYENVGRMEPDVAVKTMNEMYAEVATFWNRQLTYDLSPGNN